MADALYYKKHSIIYVIDIYVRNYEVCYSKKVPHSNAYNTDLNLKWLYSLVS